MSDSSNINSAQQQGSLLEKAQSAAGVVGGHAQLANGATQEQIGNLLNSEDWKKSGIDIQGDAGQNIKKAFEDFKAQGGNESDLVNKASKMADSACPQTGEGVGDKSNS